MIRGIREIRVIRVGGPPFIIHGSGGNPAGSPTPGGDGKGNAAPGNGSGGKGADP